MSRSSSASSSIKKGKAPKREPTDSSYFTFGGTPHNGEGSATWMYANDARAQIANSKGLAQTARKDRYPSQFMNYPQQGGAALGTRALKPLSHTPLMPGREQPYQRNEQPGAWRAVYNDNDRATFDPMYHDAKKPPVGSGKHNDFSLGHYYPKSTRRALNS